MCANYILVTSAERLLKFFGVARGIDEPMREVFPSGLAPFIRLAPDGADSGDLVHTVADGIFRFVPDFVAKVEWARNNRPSSGLVRRLKKPTSSITARCLDAKTCDRII